MLKLRPSARFLRPTTNTGLCKKSVFYNLFVLMRFLELVDTGSGSRFCSSVLSRSTSAREFLAGDTSGEAREQVLLVNSIWGNCHLKAKMLFWPFCCSQFGLMDCKGWDIWMS